MSKSNRAVVAKQNVVEQAAIETVVEVVEVVETVETVTLSGVDEQGSWEAELYVAEQSEAAKPESTMSAAVALIVNGGQNKSNKIRSLLALGLKRGEVAKLLGIRYQHVRNVEITPVKRAG
jgi:hypothetical protein